MRSYIYRAGLFIALLSAGCGSDPSENDALDKDVVKTEMMTAVQSAQTVTGRIAATFGTNATGASIYTLPIEVPPGINKAAPHLQLSYSSNNQAGLMGVGWSLSGPDKITRCAAIPAVDGYRGAIEYNQNDRFCIGGQRLIKVGNSDGGANPEYTAGGSIYRTELDTWRLFTASAQSCGIGPCSFTVNAPDGSVLQFGATADSRVLQENGSAVRNWAVSSVTDKNGNVVSYSYTSTPVSGQPFAGNGRVYLEAIRYGSNVNGGGDENRDVAFEYEMRPDPQYAFVGGGQVLTQARLSMVTSSVGGVSRAYKLDYGDTSVATLRSLLRSVTECVTGASGETCKPSTLFTWQESPVSVSMSNLTPSIPSSYKGLFPGDINGDGRGDILQVTQTGATALADPYISTGADLVPCGSKASLPASTVAMFLPMDVNGDGRLDLTVSDIVSSRFTLTPWITGEQNCQMRQGTKSQGPASGKPDYQWPMDVNGDGRTDLVAGWENSASQIITLVSFVSNGAQLNQGQTSQIPITPDKTLYWPMDVNADGMVDLVFGKETGATLVVATAINKDGSFTLASAGSTTINNALTIEYWPLDINGDGNVDLVQAWESGGRLSLSTFQADGAGGFSPGRVLTTGVDTDVQLGIWSMDIVGDGSTDLVLASETSGTIALRVFLANGNGLAAGQSLQSNLTSDNYKTVWPLDINGDGRVDLVQGEVNSATMSFQSWVANGGKPDLLSTSTDGYGKKITYEYLPMSNTDVYVASADGAPSANEFSGLGFGYRLTPAAAPYQPVTGGVMHLVSKSTESVDAAINPLGYEYIKLWQYAGALIDHSGRGWLGFAQVTSLELDDGLRTIKNYQQLFPETGTVVEVEKQCVATANIVTPDPSCPQGSTGTTLSKSASDYEVDTTAQGLSENTPEVVQVLLSSLKMDSYTYGAYDFSRDKTYEHDEYGNVTRLMQGGKYNQQSPPASPPNPTYSCAAYADDPQQVWMFGLVSKAKVSTDSTSCADFDTAAYNDAYDLQLNELTFTNDKRRNLASHLAWDDQHNNWLAESYQYDDFGNAVSVTGPGVQPTLTQIETTYNTFKQKTEFPEGLSEEYSFDPLTGTLVGLKHQNGAISISCLDGISRLQMTQAAPPDSSSVSNDNCIPANATGDRATMAAAKVATTRNISYLSSQTSGIRYQVEQLQSWDDASDTLTTSSIIDGRARARIVVTQGKDPSSKRHTCTDFDHSNRTIGASVPAYSTDALPSCSIDPAKPWVTTQFDTYQRVRLSDSPDATGATTTDEYSWAGGLVMTMTQASQSSAPYIRDVHFDWFNGQRKPVSMSVRGASMTSAYQWDGLGRLISTIDPVTPTSPQGVETRIKYDSLGRKINVFNPDQTNATTENNPAWAATYDQATGNLSSVVDASAQLRKLAYDGLGRMVSRTLADGSETKWTYDGPGFGAGRVWTVTGTASDGSTLYIFTYGYDAAGNITTKKIEFPADSLSYEMVYTYDPLKRLREVTWPDGTSYEQAYTDDNLVSVSFDGSVIATWSDHTALGSPETATYANGVDADWQYASTGQILNTVIKQKSGVAAVDSALGWDPLWNLGTISDSAKLNGVDRSQTFTYQHLRLTQAQAPGLYGTLTYGYDASGNIIEQGDTTFNYRAHQILEGKDSGTVNYTATYDGNGNISTRTVAGSTWNFTYDPLNRLTKVEEAGVTTLQAPIYGPKGARLKKIDSSSAQTWYVSPYLRITEKAGVWTYDRIIRGANNLVAKVSADGKGDSAGSSPTTLYVHQDYLNSTTLTTDEAGAVASVLAYAPWGSPSSTGSSGPDNVREKFQGRELDSVSTNTQNSIYYFGARYYDPAVGRFLSPDNQLGSHLLRQDAQNRYAFALNNPVTVTDPTGHFSISAIIGAVVDSVLVVAGIAVDVLSEGALEPVGGGLIGAGINGLQYSVTHGNHFSWEQFGVQNAVGGALGVATGGLGAAADAGEAGASAGVGEAEQLSTNAAVDGSEDSLANASDSVSTDDAGPASDEAESPTEEEDNAETCEGNSFPAGTLVLTQGGGLPIETLQSGDIVLGIDQLNPVLATQSVGKTYVSDAEKLVSLTLADGAVTETIKATAIHPFWVRHTGWVEAVNIAPGQEIFSASGAWLKVIDAEEHSYDGPVYNFSVNEAHTYFVGALQAWVHNPKGAGRCDIGGRHYQNTKQVEYKLVESNHFPASSAYDGTPYSSVPVGWRPAVNMDYVDHLETESWGSSSSAVKWRAQQTTLINKGQFADAMRMDIEDMKLITKTSTGDPHYLASGMQEAVEFAAKPNPHLGGSSFITTAERDALIKIIWK